MSNLIKKEDYFKKKISLKALQFDVRFTFYRRLIVVRLNVVLRNSGLIRHRVTSLSQTS